MDRRCRPKTPDPFVTARADYFAACACTALTLRVTSALERVASERGEMIVRF
jgi:hypothetical protein